MPEPEPTSARHARLLLLGDGFSAFGAWIDFLAILTLAAWQLHVSAYEMAAVGAAGLLPGILAAPAIGRWCDRRDPKRLLLLSIVGRIAATAAILFCRDYAAFLALVALRSVFATVAPPAINVMAVRAIAAAERPRFYALLNVLNNAAKVLAPAIGTVSSSLSGEAVALAMSLACSVAAFATFLFLPPRPAPSAGTAAAGAAPAATGGRLLPLLWIVATCAGFVFMVNNLVPLVLQRAGLDKALLGVLVGCAGAGNLLSGLWLARRGAASRLQGALGELLRPAVAQAAGFGAIGLLLAGPRGSAPVTLPIAFFLIGTASARYAIALNVHLSTHFAASIGRVSGQIQSWQNAMILVAPMVGAVVLERLGAPALFAFATGSAGLSFAALLAFSRASAARSRRSASTGSARPDRPSSSSSARS